MPKVILAAMCFFNPYFPALVLIAGSSIASAGIDSGGGSSSIGTMSNFCSIGGGFATFAPAQANPLPGDPPQPQSRNFSGLAEVIYRVSPSTVTDFNPAADADQDGSSNLMEYLAGTNPDSATSMFHPEGIYSDGLFRMPIPTLSGRDYHVWASRDLKSWTLYRTLSGNDAVRLFEFDETAIASGPLYSSRHPSNYFFKIQITFPDFDPAADADLDGSSDQMEYLAGTDPNNAASVFRPQGTYADGLFRMPIPTISDRSYRIWGSRDLQNWTLHSTLIGNGAVQLFQFDETSVTAGPLQSDGKPSSCFFRIQILIP
jgi:hypothetical protein